MRPSFHNYYEVSEPLFWSRQLTRKLTTKMPSVCYAKHSHLLNLWQRTVFSQSINFERRETGSLSAFVGFRSLDHNSCFGVSLVLILFCKKKKMYSRGFYLITYADWQPIHCRLMFILVYANQEKYMVPASINN